MKWSDQSATKFGGITGETYQCLPCVTIHDLLDHIIFHMGHVTWQNPNGPDLIIPTRTHYKIFKISQYGSRDFIGCL